MKENNHNKAIESDMGDPNMEWDDISICADCVYKPNRPQQFLCIKYGELNQMNKAIFSRKCDFYAKK